MLVEEKFGEIFVFGIYLDDNNRIRYRWVCSLCQKMFDCGGYNLMDTFEDVRKHYFNYQIGNGKNVKNTKVVENKSNSKNKREQKKIQQKKGKK